MITSPRSTVGRSVRYDPSPFIRLYRYLIGKNQLLSSSYLLTMQEADSPSYGNALIYAT